MTEFALILPILLLLVFGVIEFARLMFVYSAVATASREASRYGAAVGVGPNGVPFYIDCGGIRGAAQRSGRFAGIGDSDIAIQYDTGPGTYELAGCDPNPIDYTVVALGDRLIVTVTAVYTPIIPVPMVNVPSFPISSTAVRTIIKGVHLGSQDPGGNIGKTANFPTPTFTVTPTFTATHTPGFSPTATLVPTETYTPTVTPVPPWPPIYNSVSWTASGNSCNNIFLVWGPNPEWPAYPGESPSSYQMSIDGSPAGTLSPGDPGLTSWNTGRSLTNGQTIVFDISALFPGPLGSELMTKVFICEKGTLSVIGE